MTTRSTSKKATPLAPLFMAYDDGAGDVKGILGDGQNIKPVRAKFAAITGLWTGGSFGMDEVATLVPIQVRAPLYLNGGAPIYDPTGMTVGVGDAMIDSATAGYDIGDDRYTSDAAVERFRAMLGTLLGQLSTQLNRDIYEVEIARLVVGSNVDFFDRARTLLPPFFNRTWEFAVDGHEYKVRVHHTDVYQQPWGAAKYIATHPKDANKAIQERFERYPFMHSLVVMVDPGNFTVDVVRLTPKIQPDGSIRLFAAGKDFFALKNLGVDAFRREVERYLLNVVGYRPDMAAIDQVLKTGMILNQFGESVAVGSTIDTIRSRFWNRVVEEIRSRLGAVQPVYIGCVGGGTDVFRKEITNSPWGSFPGLVIPAEPAWSIVNGYWVIALEQREQYLAEVENWLASQEGAHA